MTFLTVYGHTCIDQILRLSEFPLVNTSVDIFEKRRYFGGTGANIATVAASLGVPTALVSFVGSDLPPDFERWMEGRGVDLSELVKVDGFETPTVFIVSNRHHDQVAYVYQGPMAVLDDLELKVVNARRSRHVHIATGRPEYYIRVMENLPDEVFIALDPAQEIHRIWNPSHFRRALPLVDMLFSNQYEAERMLEYAGAHSPQEMVDGLGLWVITRGAEGIDLVTTERVERVPAIRTEVQDTTGAGDSFRAGFYAGKYRGMSDRDAAVIGTATASFTVETVGCQTNIPDWDGVMERAEPYL